MRSDLAAAYGQERLARYTSYPTAPHFSGAIDGVVELDGTQLSVSDQSRFLVRSVAAAFDAHLDASKQLHSRAV